jgi:hypothetical protein
MMQAPSAGGSRDFLTEGRIIGNRIISRFYRYRAADLYLAADSKDEETRQAFLFGLIDIPAYRRAGEETKKAVLRRVLAGLSFAGARKALEAEAAKVAASIKTPKLETQAVPSEKKKERHVTFETGSGGSPQPGMLHSQRAGHGGSSKLKEGVAPPSAHKPQTRRKSAGSFRSLVPLPKASKAPGTDAEAQQEDEESDDGEEGAEGYTEEEDGEEED